MSAFPVSRGVLALGLSASLLLPVSTTYAQRKPSNSSKPTGTVLQLEEAEQPPRYPGGDQQLMAYLLGSYQYPTAAQERGIKGIVLVDFVIGADGKVRDVQTASQVGGGCTEEALRLVRTMPAWVPAQHQGKPVAVAVAQFPVSFPPPYWKEPRGTTARAVAENEKNQAALAQLEAKRKASQEVQPVFAGARDAGSALEYFRKYVRFQRDNPGGPVEGTVYLQFTVAEDGQVRNAHIIGDVCPPCDAEVLRVAQTMPRWVPGRRQGRPTALPVGLGIHYASYFADGKNQPEPPAGVLKAAEVAPNFPGGPDSLMNYLRRAYPPDPTNRSSGVLAEFVVRPDGSLTDVRIVEGRGEQQENAQNIALIQGMPRWKPGLQNGKPVAVRSTLFLPYRALAGAKGYPEVVIGSSDLKGLPPAPRPQNTGEEAKASEEQPYMYVEQMPQFPGGTEALAAFVQKNVHYPAVARQNGVQGRVFVSFVIKTDGSVGNVKVTKGIASGCDEEAVRVIKALPRWTPGKQNGRLVPVSYTFPVVFALTQPGTSGSSGDKLYGASAAAPIPAPVRAQMVQQRASYEGGMAALRREVQGQLRYPTQDLAERRQGTVYVAGTVPATGGKLLDPKVQHGIAPAFDEEALRVVKQLKHFTPYKEDGKPKPSTYLVPVVFELKDDGQLMTAEELQKRADSRVYTYVEQMPQFRGGSTPAMVAYVQQQLRLPEEVKSGKVEGKVFVRFTVTEDGQVRDVVVQKDISDAADAEAVRVVRTMEFEPGKQNGQVVNVSYTLPVSFVSPNHVYELRELSRRPEFPGGDMALRDFLVKTPQEPSIVKSEKMRGNVTVRFVVQPDGRIANPEITTSLCRSCDEEALRVVRAMPAWVPGQLNEKNVPSYQEAQISFGN